MSLRIARPAQIASGLLLALIVGTMATRPGTSQSPRSVVLGVQLVGGGSSAPGQTKDNGSDKKDFTISGHVTGLFPGAHAPLELTLTNPNNFPIDVQTLAASVQAPSPSGCPPAVLTIAGFSGHLAIPANATATRTLVATMASGASNACENVSFPLKYSGTAVKP